MLFHTTPFLFGFLPATLSGFFLLGRIWGATSALRWLVVANLVFYGWWNPEHLPLLIGSVLVNHTIAGKIRSTTSRGWAAVGIALNLAALGWFKYAGFLLGSAAPDITLPLAISFFTFQQIMFLTDPSAVPSMLPYAAFVTFFPHLIAGPIVRPAEIVPQLTAPDIARPNADNLTNGLIFFLLGLAKKLVLADLFGHFTDIGFDAVSQGATLTFFEAWYATLSYALQIYFDFSGYSDMATGLARMFNVWFPPNFDSPYQASNIAEFWRRWHMTLGTFLRDFLYIPLGGNRRWAARNLMITMLLCGLWHGAAWRFVFWGGLHGGFLVVHRAWRWPMPRKVAHALTLVAIVVAWVPFRADSFAEALAMLRAMVGANGIALPRLIVEAIPVLGAIARPVTLLPHLADGRTLSFPEVTACLFLGWTIVLTMPNIHRMTDRSRHRALTAGFALSLQALFFAPHVAPFLYFRF